MLFVELDMCTCEIFNVFGINAYITNMVTRENFKSLIFKNFHASLDTKVKSNVPDP